MVEPFWRKPKLRKTQIQQDSAVWTFTRPRAEGKKKKENGEDPVLRRGELEANRKRFEASRESWIIA